MKYLNSLKEIRFRVKPEEFDQYEAAAACRDRAYRATGI